MVLVVSEWPRLPVWAGADGIAEGALYRKCLIKKKKKRRMRLWQIRHPVPRAAREGRGWISGG